MSGASKSPEDTRADGPSDALAPVSVSESPAPLEDELSSEGLAARERASEAAPEFLGIHVGGRRLALPLAQIVEVLRPLPLAELPRVPAFLRGVAQHRAEILPVFDLAARLGLASDVASAKTRLVVVKTDRGGAGLLVAEVAGVWRDAQLEGSAIHFGGERLPVLDLDAVVDWRTAMGPLEG